MTDNRIRTVIAFLRLVLAVPFILVAAILTVTGYFFTFLAERIAGREF